MTVRSLFEYHDENGRVGDDGDDDNVHDDDGDDDGDDDHSHDVDVGGHAQCPPSWSSSSWWSHKALNLSHKANAPNRNSRRPDPLGRQTLDDFVGSMIDSEAWREGVAGWF